MSSIEKFYCKIKGEQILTTKEYQYIIIGGGVCGCSTAYQLSQDTTDILLIDKNKDVAMGASGAAGAFLSPLLGKPNKFKDLVARSLKYSTKFYKENFNEFIKTCGTVRIPKDEQDKEKFETYKPYIDFEYTKKEQGYYFPIGSVVQSYQICKKMIKRVQTQFNYEVNEIFYDGKCWVVNNEFKAKNLILATGYETTLLDQFYIQIRAVWGRRIDVTTSTKVDLNFHKACSISKSAKNKDGLYSLSIGATHHRDKKGVENIDLNHKNLLEKANDILKLENVNIINDYVGARACSVDYFPILGEVIDGEATLKEFPYLRHGTHVQQDRFTRYKNLYIINGVGGRGFVLAPFLAKELVSFIINGDKIEKELTVERLFRRGVKKR